MPSWNELVEEIQKIADPKQGNAWLVTKQREWLQKLSAKRGGWNVLFYASGFLQKPQAAPIFLQIAPEDINGFMAGLHGMDYSQGLTIILHTPGGITNATETIVEYLHSKFTDIEVIIPTYAMSAGTMISLASNRLIMGKQSQLGPIDPQMPIGGRTVSARAIVDQFEQAKKDILADPQTAALWASPLQSLGPALLMEARNALDYGETMVARWLAKRHFQGNPNAQKLATEVASYFNRSDVHKSHGRRINCDEAAAQKLEIIKPEDDQELQEIVLTTYHLATLVFEKGPCVKFIINQLGRGWVKNFGMPMPSGIPTG
jgi:hypothetical protein